MFWFLLFSVMADFFENSFNYDYSNMGRVEIKDNDDLVIMGDLIVVLPDNKKTENGKELKKTIINQLKEEYQKDKNQFNNNGKNKIVNIKDLGNVSF